MILGPPQLKPLDAATWASSRGAPRWWCELAFLVWDLDGIVRPEVMWAQSCKETGFAGFGGVLDATFRNPCGMKRTTGGSNDDPDGHQRFTTWGHGFLAQHDHLALYAGAEGFPLKHTPDPRHFAWLHGRAPTVESLSNNWAGAGYGESLRDRFLNPLLAWGS